MSKSQKSAELECVKVIVRCRPMSEKETMEGYKRVVDMNISRGLVELKQGKDADSGVKAFTFDAVYDWNSKQQELYDETFRGLVESVLDGFNGTIFAYGQTGTGKTYTMEGVRADIEKRGVIPNSFDHIFSHIARSQNKQYLVRASYLEIYQEEVRDLLCKDQFKRLELKERPDVGVYVKDLSSFVCNSVKEIEHVMSVGNQNRSVGPTNMNEHSSRSHAIFMITVESSELGADNQNHIRVGKLNLVDLAGSERQSKTGSMGERLKEATKINLSLSALSNVISALVDGKSSHIPYRDSKLTRLLQDSLGGNAKTIMVANIGPASYNYEETLTTLRYSNRAKNIKNKPKINEDPKDTLLREFQQEIAKLKAQLVAKGGNQRVARRRKESVEMNGTAEDEEDPEEEEEEEVEDEVDNAEYLKQQFEKEREAIINNQNLISEEKEKVLKELNKKHDLLQKEQDARDKLAQKIKAMESKLLSGERNIIDHTNEQQRELEIRKQEIIEQKRREREMQQKLEAQEETALEIRETFSSLQQEVDIKTRKLKKLFGKLEAVKQEIQDIQEEHSRERQEMEQTQNELTRELKLKYLIIENFIPPKEKLKIMQRIFFDEDEEQWKLLLSSMATNNESSKTTILKRPVSASGCRRPTSEYARVNGRNGNNPRYKGENIMLVDLDLPSKTTRDYVSPAVAPRVQAVLDAALKGEEDLDIDASFISTTDKKSVKKGRGMIPVRA
ncbi:Kinesin-like protein kif3b [Chamberlinius hualienensis]